MTEEKLTEKDYEVLDACCELLSIKIDELKAENDRLKLSERDLSKICQGLKKDIETEKSYTLKYYKILQEIKGVVTALYMNNWLQMNETARKSIQLLQELITKAEEE